MKKPSDFNQYCIVALQNSLDLRKGKDLLKVRSIVNLSIKNN
jgi:hypothetical protein